jgi:hypothetical protein
VARVLIVARVAALALMPGVGVVRVAVLHRAMIPMPALRRMVAAVVVGDAVLVLVRDLGDHAAELAPGARRDRWVLVVRVLVFVFGVVVHRG